MYIGSLGTISNRETWQEAWDCIDENGDDVNIAAATVVLEVRKKNDTAASLTATNGDGITIATPRITMRFEVADIRDLTPGTYDVGCTVLLSGDTTQFILGTVTVLDGVVS